MYWFVLVFGFGFGLYFIWDIVELILVEDWLVEIVSEVVYYGLIVRLFMVGMVYVGWSLGFWNVLLCGL